MSPGQFSNELNLSGRGTFLLDNRDIAFTEDGGSNVPSRNNKPSASLRPKKDV